MSNEQKGFQLFTPPGDSVLVRLKVRPVIVNGERVLVLESAGIDQVAGRGARFVGQSIDESAFVLYAVLADPDESGPIALLDPVEE